MEVRNNGQNKFKSFIVRSVLLSGQLRDHVPDVAIAIKLASVIGQILNNASPVKFQANLQPSQFGTETAKFNHLISQFPVS